jgi:hypothetical protein
MAPGRDRRMADAHAVHAASDDGMAQMELQGAATG